MPRAKYVHSEYALQYNMIGYFKSKYPDFLFDFKYIYKDLIDFFDNSSIPVNQIKSKSEILESIKISPNLTNRTYIVTNYDDVVFAAVNMDCSVVDNLIDVFSWSSFLSENTPEQILGSYLSTLYIFKGDKMCLNARISPFKVAQLMAVFKTENIVNFQGARDDYYAAPRRKHKKSLG